MAEGEARVLVCGLRESEPRLSFARHPAQSVCRRKCAAAEVRGELREVRRSSRTRRGKHVSEGRRRHPGFGQGSAPGRWQPAGQTSFFLNTMVIIASCAKGVQRVCGASMGAPDQLVA